MNHQLRRGHRLIWWVLLIALPLLFLASLRVLPRLVNEAAIQQEIETPPAKPQVK